MTHSLLARFSVLISIIIIITKMRISIFIAFIWVYLIVMLKNKNQTLKIRWSKHKILKIVKSWRIQMCKKYRAYGERSMWWTFIPTWDKNIGNWINDFCEGEHQFSPISHYEFKDGVARVWTYQDRLIMHLIFTTLRPTFKHIISPLCKHLAGPSVIRRVTKQIKEALSTGLFGAICLSDLDNALLKNLHLKISSHKTRTGALKKGFHHLGVNFVVSRNSQIKIQEIAINLHPRSCRRALDKVIAMRSNAVHLAKIQHYLVSWTVWWQNVLCLNFYDLLYSWVINVARGPTCIWLGRGVLLCHSPALISNNPN
jgi:hypothetical protein